MVERFTRVDENTIQYQATIDDPNVFTRPWTVAFPLNRDEPYRIFEYACHEGTTRSRPGAACSPARDCLRGTRIRKSDTRSSLFNGNATVQGRV